MFDAYTYTKYDYTDNNRLQYVTKREDDQNGRIIQRKEYVYDNNGNQTNVYDVTNGQTTITTNTYTLLNQLESTETTGIDKLMVNTYNAEGKRVAKTVDEVTTRYFYEYNDVAFEYTNSGEVSAFNVIGINIISRDIGSDKVYYFNNGHADVTALLDATTKKIRSQYRYDEFGNITSEIYYDRNGIETTDEDEIIKSQILYAGYQYDEESKYYNLHARYYDPQTARFLQEDTYRGTIADPLSLNLYTYCHNEPMMYYDPTGHAEKTALNLIDEIITAKKIYEEEQKKRDKMWFFQVAKYRRTEAQEEAAKNAEAARQELKNTEAYTDPNLKKEIDRYLSKEFGGTMEDVLELKKKIMGYHMVINEKNRANNSNIPYDESSSNKGTGKTGEMTISDQGLKTIANFELSEATIKAWGLGAYDDNGNLIGIYPHYVFKKTDNGWVSDGGITFGYGHYVSKGEYDDVSSSERALVDKYAKGAPILPLKTPSNGVAYRVPGSSYVPIAEVMRLYKEDIAGSVQAVNGFLSTHKISLKQHQFDMLVSFSHNYGDGWWSKTNRALPKFIIEGKGNYDPKEVIRVFEMHDNKGRRTIEANIFNNGYK